MENRKDDDEDGKTPSPQSRSAENKAARALAHIRALAKETGGMTVEELLQGRDEGRR
jgi:hypothetical protein